MSTIDAATADFPPTFITGGHGDPLTDTQSRPMANRLEDLGVPVTTLFFDEDHEPAIPHEFQFHLDQVEVQFAGEGQRVRQRLDTDLFAVGTDESDLSGADAVVDPGLVVDGRRSYGR